MNTVGPYRVLGALGEGGGGTVYECAARDGRVVAVKVLRRDLGGDPTRAARFDREARAVARVRHPHIVPLLDAGALDDGRPYLVMPRLRGTTLRAALDARQRPMAPEEAWRIVRAVAGALAAAHAAGVVHRDVKPDNVFLEERGGTAVPRLLDFGLAREVEGAATVTDAGAPVGTAGYMPPEQWWNDGVGPAADQYALGVMAYELLAGRRPFPGDGYVALMQRHLSAPAPTLASAGVAAAPAVEAWLARALAKAPGDRFPSMTALRDAGDAAFGRAVARPWTAALAPWVAALAAPVALAAAGYAGGRDPAAWMRLAGWGFFPTVGLFAVAVAALAVRSRRLAPLALPGAHGALAAGTGWLTVLAAMARYPPGTRFEVFNEGMAEANVNRFVGYGLAAGCVAASLLAREAPAAREPRARAEVRALAAGGALVALTAALSGVASGALVAGAFALTAWAWGTPARDDEEAARAGRALLAVALAVVAALARADARSAVAWTTSPTRAARAAELIAAAQEQRATLAIAALALGAVGALGVARARRAARGRVGVGRRGKVALGLLAAWALADGAVALRVGAQRDALWAALGPRFALFARLDPPAAEGLPAPQVAPSLQLSRDVVALDGARVGLVGALANPEGATSLALDLSHRLARDGGVGAGPAQLSVLVDRRVAWGAVARALGVAYGLGVRRVEVLLTRGPAPRLSPSAPAEAGYALPRDFGAVRVELRDGDGEAFPAAATFEAVARTLARRGTAAVRVAR